MLMLAHKHSFLGIGKQEQQVQSNTDGTGKAYTYSVSTTSGFSIVKYLGNGSAGHTIGHHLGAVPQVVIYKNWMLEADWLVYHKEVGNDKELTLNGTGASINICCIGIIQHQLQLLIQFKQIQTIIQMMLIM